MADAKPYGPAIHQAIASGDLAKLKEISNLGDARLKEYGVSADDQEALKREIDKLEKPKGG
jgi:uncharacterized protein DUF1843